MVKFYYPETLEEALEIRGSGRKVIPLAGGTDLMVRYENWSSLPANFPSSVMAIQHLDELKYIREEGDFLIMGAALPISTILEYQGLPLCLKLALEGIAAPALRNLATLAGNIQNASPAADSLPPLLLMDAQLTLCSARGRRKMPVQDFIKGPGETVLEEDELLESIAIPLDFIRAEGRGNLMYRKIGTRKANALSKLSACFWWRWENDRLEDIRLTLGAVAPRVLRLQNAEKGLLGLNSRNLEASWKKIRKMYVEAIRPIDDQRSTAHYRKQTALHLLDAFIKDAPGDQ